MFNRILVVCVGNICRSPMAEGLLKKELNGAGMHGIEVRSAGLNALAGEPADKIAVRLMQDQGIDISAHRGQQLDREVLHWADLVLVMESSQKRDLEVSDPTVRGKVYLMGEWGNFDVPDPYRKPEKAFETAIKLIAAGVSDWVQKLRE